MKKSHVIATVIATTTLLILIAKSASAVPPQAKTLTNSAQELVGLLAKERYAAVVKHFDQKMANALPEEKVREVWKAVLAKAGPFKRVVSAKATKVQQYDAILVRCDFQTSPMVVKVIYNDKRQVSGLSISKPED